MTMRISILILLCLMTSCAQETHRIQQIKPLEPESVRYSEPRAYTAAVKHKIKINLDLPHGLPSTASATFDVALSDTGSVADLRLINSSGYAAYEEAIRKAILRAQPLPVLITAESAKPVQLRLLFKVEE